MPKGVNQGKVQLDMGFSCSYGGFAYRNWSAFDHTSWESMNESTKDMIKRHEGFRPYIYLDTVGVPTGGYGHAFHAGSVLPDTIWELIFEADYQTALDDYEELGFDLDQVRKAVVIDMLFNLGRGRFLQFKNTIAAIRAGDWERAACGMENSAWYGQVRTRAVKLVRMMRTGEFQVYPIQAH